MDNNKEKSPLNDVTRDGSGDDENTLLADDELDDPGTDLTNKVHMKMISTMNDKMEAMASNVALLGSSVKR